MAKSPLVKEFKIRKEEFKNLVHQYIDAGGSQSSLEGKLVKCLNPKGKDRIAKKVARFFKKHKRVETNGNLEDLTQKMQASALELSSIYKSVDNALWITPSDCLIDYKDFRKAKEGFVKVLKGISLQEMPKFRETLIQANLESKTIAKIGTIEKKLSKSKKNSKAG